MLPLTVVLGWFALLCGVVTAVNVTSVTCRPDRTEIVPVEAESLTLAIALPGPRDPSHTTLCLHVHSYLFAAQAIFNVSDIFAFGPDCEWYSLISCHVWFCISHRHL